MQWNGEHQWWAGVGQGDMTAPLTISNPVSPLKGLDRLLARMKTVSSQTYESRLVRHFVF